MVGHFEYYKDYCVCRGSVFIQMRDLNGNEAYQWPVNVYDVNENFLAAANDRNEFMSVWNSSGYNQQVGRLIAGYGPFGFQLLMNADQSAPEYVIGDLGVVVDLGIYENEYGDEYE